MFPSVFPSRSVVFFAVAFAGLCGSASPSAFGATQAVVPPAVVESPSTLPVSSDAARYPVEFAEFAAIPPAETDLT
ncbi:MAG: hypothetical protein IJ387_09530, partial [Thermoguttaceae bacterium]|nr:hypothetical protein [Thermoguttaceae bacterium]